MQNEEDEATFNMFTMNKRESILSFSFIFLTFWNHWTQDLCFGLHWAQVHSKTQK